MEWMPSSKDEFRSVITKYSDLSLPGPDKICGNILSTLSKTIHS